jgi:hypothetical protein
MKKCLIALALSVVLVIGTAAAGLAAMGEGTVKANKGVDITLFGSNRVMPSYYRNFDFDDDANDGAILTEGGFGAGYFVRNELRLGFKGTGENWGFKVILEDDIHMTKDNGDRNTYSGYGATPGVSGTSDFGSEFSVERSNFWYDFGGVKFSVGWDVKAYDIKTGGLVYGDDHPFMSLTGGDKTLNWELMMLLINTTDDINDLVTSKAPNDFDWYAYSAKVNYTIDSGELGKFTVSPFVALSDMGSAVVAGPVAKGYDAQTWYLGLEGYGNFGIFQPSFEVAYATGDIKDAYIDGSDVNVDSWAAFAGLTLALCPEFNPYVTATYQQGDDDPLDDDAEGFVGITNIARYTPYGMDNSILYEHFGGGEGFGAPLYALSTERATKGNVYGGLGNGGSGNNPGLIFIAAGAKGKIQKLSYNVRGCYLQYDEEDALAPGIDDELGWNFDGQLKYPLSDNFYTMFTASYFVAGDGIEEYNEYKIGDAYDSEDAWLTVLELGWTW